MRLFPIAVASLALIRCAQSAQFQAGRMNIDVAGSASVLFTCRSGGAAVSFAPPIFPIDGVHRTAELTQLRQVGNPARLANGTTEFVFEGQFRQDSTLTLQLRFRAAGDNPVLRFQYLLKSSREHRLTKRSGADDLTYVRTSLQSFPTVTEIRISEFLEQTHSNSLQELQVPERDFQAQRNFMGPILAASNGRTSILLAYEHGSQVPDAFLEYRLTPDHNVEIAAAKANYIADQRLGGEQQFQTVWFEAAVVDDGMAALRSSYRDFVLRRMALNNESRKPYIFYNTWNFQERNRNWYGKPYLASMNEERLLAEIDVAHKMGIEVFVIDTGWYEKTGDWRVSSARFPHGLQPIKKRLDSYGMKLGLWFDPTAAAISSHAFQSHSAGVMSRGGKVSEPQPIWETERSHRMCLISDWADAFANELIRAYRELGVTYFKWDAVGQYGCDSPKHRHGDESVTEQERAQSYAFQLPGQLARIVEKLTAACPNAIVDFDITEAGRAVGLAFLSAGKYFLINNGPYYQNYDVPIDPAKDNWNLFFHKGPARTWICRSGLTYDSWIPSVLFLTHYLPDDPYESQIVNIASLILGQNGIWGDLPAISDKGVATFHRLIGLYKQVREDVTQSIPVTSGAISGASEIHEKINATGRGAVVIFSTSAGSQTYVTDHRPVRNFVATPGLSVQFAGDGRALLHARFDKPGAAIVFFGADEAKLQ